MWLENNGYPDDSRVRREAEVLVGAGYRVTVVCPREPGQPRRETIRGVRVVRYRLPTEGSGFLGFVAEYAIAMVATLIVSVRLWFRERFDVIHAHNPPDLFAFVAMPFKLLGVRFVFDHHDLSPEMYGARFGADASRIVERALRLAERVTFAMADRVIATNDSYRDIATSRGRVDPARVTIVRNGPDPARVRSVSPDPEIRALAGTVLGYVGEIGPQDGIDLLVRALAHLKDALGYEDFLCIVIGDGDARPAAEALSTQLGLGEHLRFVGRVKESDRVMQLLSSADICVDPDPSNPYNDRSSMVKLSEYLMLGKPVVAFDLREHRVTCQDAARYAAPNDEVDFAVKLLELIHDPEARERMGRSGRERAESVLAWPHQIPGLLATYDRLFDAEPDSE